MKLLSLFLITALWLPFSLQGKGLSWDEYSGWRWTMEPPVGSSDRQMMGIALDIMDEAKAEELAGNHRRARSLYREVIKMYPNSLYAAESWFQIGLIEEKDRNWQRAFDAFQKIIDEYPNYGRFNQVVGAQFQVADGLMQGNRVRLLGTLPIFRSPESAISQFNQIIINAPFSEYAPLALLNIAILNRSRDNEVETIDALERFINAYPRHFLLPDAYLLMAQTYAALVDGPAYDQGATRQSIAYYQDFLIQFPRNPRVREAETGLNDMLNMLGTSKLQMGQWYYNYRANEVAATVFFSETLTVAPGTNSALVAQALLNRIESGAAPPAGPFSRLWQSWGTKTVEADGADYTREVPAGSSGNRSEQE